MTRRIAVALGFVSAIASAGCNRDLPRAHPVDLLASLARAEKRPATEAVTAAIVTLGGVTQPALEVPALSRVVWRERLPDHAVLTTAVGVSPALSAAGRGGAVFRIGISDERAYDELSKTVVQFPSSQGWQRVSIDLSKYSGFKWSLFYQPRYKTWSIIFNTIVKGLGRSLVQADRLYWARPVVEEGR